MAVKNIVAKYSWELVYSYDSIRSMNRVNKKVLSSNGSVDLTLFVFRYCYLLERFYFGPVIRSIVPEFLLTQYDRA